MYFDEADVPEGEENYVVASVLEGGATVIEAQFEGLSELTDYAFMLCDGEYVIYEKQFATPERSYLLSEDQVDASVEASRSSVYIFLELYGYEPMGAMYASVTSADATIGKAVVFGEENLTGEEEDEYVLAEVDESDGTIYIVCGFDYLAPETTFDFALTDDGHVVYETQATTESYAVDPSSVSMTIYPGKNSWSCAFTISDYYEFDGELAVSVSDGNGQTVSYVPVSLYTEGAQKPEGFDGTYYDYAITVDGVGGSGLVGNTQYTLSVSDGGFAIYFTTFTTRNFVLDESAVTMDNQFHTDSTSGTGYFDVNYFTLTGYDPATNIVVGLYTLDGTLVQNTDFIVYNASDGNVGNSGAVQREGNAVTSITVPYIQLYGVPPGQRYYFRIYDGNTLLYEAVWIAA
ncbi:MAG: hypothetical protein ILP02_02350 [Clostridia bacterium]|nr:hypothetical protein [Clostridia bacterium]